MTPFPGWVFVPSSFVSLFIFYILSYLLLKTAFLGCFSGCLMSSASDQKLFCEVCSAFKCSFDEFVGEKVVSTSYSSAILAPLLEQASFNFIATVTSQSILEPNKICHCFRFFPPSICCEVMGQIAMILVFCFRGYFNSSLNV